MNAACPTCGRAAPPAARYCRACYTIFPPPKEEARRSGSSGKAWQLFVLALIGGAGWWAYQADTAAGNGDTFETESQTGTAGARDRPRRSQSATSSRRERGDRERRAERQARAAPAVPTAPTDWLLEIAPERICATVASCEVTIRFPSGETARFAVQRRQESRSALLPAGDLGRRLLSRNSRGTLVAPATESPALPIVKLGERWVGLGGLGAAALPDLLEPAMQRGP